MWRKNRCGGVGRRREKDGVSVHVVERTDGEGIGGGYDGLTFLGLVSGKPHFNE